MNDAKATVWAVVLNWRGLADTRRCLASLEAQTYEPLRLLVVDNGSADGSADALQTLRGVDLLALEHNFGFAGGMNRGVAHARAAGARYVLLCNNDAVLAETCLAALVRALDAAPEAAAAAPTLFWGRPHARERLWYAGGSLGHWTGVVRHWTHRAGTGTRSVSFLSGCCLLVRPEALLALGGLNEDYFLYFEDVELCERLTRGGHSLLYVGGAEAWHAAGASTGSEHLKAASLDYYDVRNGLRFILGRPGAVRRLVALGYLACVRLPRKLLRIALTSPTRRASLKALFDGLRDGLAGRMGAYAGDNRARQG